jgi:formylglycine-generating enzyme required for sulfatase activity
MKYILLHAQLYLPLLSLLICSIIRLVLSTPLEPTCLTEQVDIPTGEFWFGSQMQVANKVMAYKSKDGAKPRKKKPVKAFRIDVDCVSNGQFKKFVDETGYITDAERFKWSFVLENLASRAVIEEADRGLGRVRDAKEWLAVKGGNLNIFYIFNIYAQKHYKKLPCN